MPAYHSLLYQACNRCSNLLLRQHYDFSFLEEGQSASMKAPSTSGLSPIVCHQCSLADVSSLPTAYAGGNDTWHLTARKPQHHSAGWQTTSLSLARSLSSWQCQVDMHMSVFIDDLLSTRILAMDSIIEYITYGTGLLVVVLTQHY